MLTIDFIKFDLKDADAVVDGLADGVDFDVRGASGGLLPELVGHVSIVSLSRLNGLRVTVSCESSW